jgi:hypothetical protein
MATTTISKLIEAAMSQMLNQTSLTTKILTSGLIFFFKTTKLSNISMNRVSISPYSSLLFLLIIS